MSVAVKSHHESLADISPSLIVCGAYYYFWMTLLPKWKNYTIRSQVLDIDGDSGANTHRLVRVPNAELAEWDATHDEQGRLRRRNVNGVLSEDLSPEYEAKGSSPSESISKA